MYIQNDRLQRSLQYPTIKKWFLEKYPEVKMFGQTAEEASEEVETIENMKAVA